MRRYHDPIEVRLSSDEPRPSAFIWKGRLYVVLTVLAHWHERRAWWRDALEAPAPAPVPAPDVPGMPAPTAIAVASRETQVWRVEASPGRAFLGGVFDLACDDLARDDLAGDDLTRDAGEWRLVRVAD